MTKTIRAGLVGCGSLSQRGVLPHLSQPDARARVQLVAVTDAVEERARQTAERYGVPAFFTSIDEMLAGAELDLVLVITPITHHYANALAAINAGKHVYVQKAMTVTLAEADALLAARDRMGVKLAAAPGYELCSTTAQMRELITGGALGKVAVAYTYTMGFGHEHEPIRAGSGALAEIDPSWYYRVGAGPLPDVTVYSLQLITSLLGPVRRVTALANMLLPQRTWRGRTIDLETADNTVVLMEFASGALGVAVGSDSRGSLSAPWGGLELYGTDATLQVREVDNASGYPLVFEIQGGQVFQHRLDAQPYLTGEHLTIEEPHVYVDIMDLVDAIAEDRPPRASGEQARHVVEIIECAQRAARTGQTQQLSSTFMRGAP
jgi:predicted dehydrogenase